MKTPNDKKRPNSNSVPLHRACSFIRYLPTDRRGMRNIGRNAAKRQARAGLPRKQWPFVRARA